MRITHTLGKGSRLRPAPIPATLPGGTKHMMQKTDWQS